jgi:hypothetical protein
MVAAFVKRLSYLLPVASWVAWSQIWSAEGRGLGYGDGYGDGMRLGGRYRAEKLLLRRVEEGGR